MVVKNGEIVELIGDMQAVKVNEVESLTSFPKLETGISSIQVNHSGNRTRQRVHSPNEFPLETSFESVGFRKYRKPSIKYQSLINTSFTHR